jgi:hydrogenase maturation protein HypF
VAAEHGIEGPLTGLVLDGFGLGPDGTLWGGELLRMAGTRCDRLGALAPLMLPGGDRAARLPWRMAAAVLHAIGRGREIVHRFPGPEGAGVARMLAAGLNCPETSSAGRLFDAAAALLGVRQENRFEGEAAMALEELCTAPRGLPGGWRIAGDRLDLSPLLDRLADTADPAEGADLFHGTLAEGLAAFARARLPREERRIALAGGCAANRPLVESLAARLREAGLDLLVPRAMPPGDGGLALGQALVARRTLKEAA